MATTIDLFTDTDGTLLYTHNANLGNAGGVTTEPEIRSNQCQAVSTFQTVHFRHTSLTDSDHQIVFVAGAALTITRWLSSRCSSSARGYEGSLANTSGTNYTRVDLEKNGTYLASSGAVTIDGTVNQTVRMIATDNGANVDLDCHVGGTSRVTYTDTTSVIASGNPGARLYSGATVTDAAFDTWESNVASSGSWLTRNYWWDNL